MKRLNPSCISAVTRGGAGGARGRTEAAALCVSAFPLRRVALLRAWAGVGGDTADSVRCCLGAFVGGEALDQGAAFFGQRIEHAFGRAPKAGHGQSAGASDDRGGVAIGA